MAAIASVNDGTMLTTRRTRDGNATTVPRSSRMRFHLTFAGRSADVAEDNTSRNDAESAVLRLVCARVANKS